MDRKSTYGEYLAQVGARYNKLSEDEKEKFIELQKIFQD